MSLLGPDHERIRTIIEKMRATNYHGQTLGEVARDSASDMEEDTPAEVLVNTALSINWKWDLAKARLRKFKKMHGGVTTFSDLGDLLAKMSPNDFCRDVLFINGGENNERYTRLKNLVAGFLDFKMKSDLTDDWETIRKWGERVNVDDVENDPIVVGRKGIGLATVQNIKIVSGFNTSKPDRRIVQVLENMFNANLGRTSEKLPKAVHAVEEISKITNLPCIELDQLFWYWLET